MLNFFNKRTQASLFPTVFLCLINHCIIWNLKHCFSMQYLLNRSLPEEEISISRKHLVIFPPYFQLTVDKMQCSLK